MNSNNNSIHQNILESCSRICTADFSAMMDKLKKDPEKSKIINDSRILNPVKEKMLSIQ